MLTPEGRMLLFQAQESSRSFTLWFAPGGGIKADESPAECLCREIKEETGAVLEYIGPLIWRRRHTFEWNGHKYTQDEIYYFVPIEEFAPEFQSNPSETELMAFRQFGWWTPEEISVSEDVFAPRLLAKHLQALIERGIPDTLVDVGI